jgi:hypothetical protein
MSATKHTAGPLTLVGPSRPTLDTPEGGDYAVYDAHGQIIAETFARSSLTERHPARENAMLFAAATDLLRELQHAVHWFDQITQDDVARYKAAIAKATGAQA